MPEDNVIIRGGSVTIEHSSKFDDDPKGGRKAHKHKDAKLKELRVGGKKVQDLAPDAVVEIVYTEP